MHISAAELETIVKKAVIGAGAPYGTGKEIGTAALALSNQNIDPSPVVALVLEGLKGHEVGQFHLGDAIHGHFVPTGSHISTILAGPSICDLLASGQDTVITQSLDSPLLAIALIAARSLNAEIHDTAGNLQSVRCKDGEFSIAKEEISSWCHTADIKFCSLPDRGATKHKQTNRAIEVNDVCWQDIVNFAAKCLVSNSEASRVKDAGAGLVDED